MKNEFGRVNYQISDAEGGEVKKPTMEEKMAKVIEKFKKTRKDSNQGLGEFEWVITRDKNTGKILDRYILRSRATDYLRIDVPLGTLAEDK
jgi:hypothetical protein